MNCKETKLLLSEFLDGELDAAAMAAVRSHVEACAECRRELSDLEATIGLLRTVREVEPPAHLVSKIMAGVAAGSAQSQGGGLWYFISSPQFRVAAAACLVLGICTYGLLHVPGPAPEAAPVSESARKTPSVAAKSPVPVAELEGHAAKDAYKETSLANRRSGKLSADSPSHGESSVKKVFAKPAPPSESLASMRGTGNDSAPAAEEASVTKSLSANSLPGVEVDGEKLEKSTSRDRAGERSQIVKQDLRPSAAPLPVVLDDRLKAGSESRKTQGGVVATDLAPVKKSVERPVSSVSGSFNQPADELVTADKKKGSAELAYSATPSPTTPASRVEAPRPSVSSSGKAKRAAELPVDVARTGPRIGLYEGDNYRALEKKDSERQSKNGDIVGAVEVRKESVPGNEARTFRQITLVMTNDPATGWSELVRVAGRHSVAGREGSEAKQSPPDLKHETSIQIRQAAYSGFIADLRKLGSVTVKPVVPAAQPGTDTAAKAVQEAGTSHLIRISVEIVP